MQYLQPPVSELESYRLISKLTLCKGMIPMNYLQATSRGLILIASVSIVCMSAISASVMAADETVAIEPPAEGSVSQEQGLAAWSRIFEVTSHPRCAN